MSIVEREGQPLQNRDYRQHLNRNWDNINGFEKTINSQIKQVLSNPPTGTADEVTQLRIDTQGNEYPLAKPRIDSIERAAINAEKSLSEKADKNYIDNYLMQINYVPETVINLADLKAKYPSGKPGLFIAADNGHKYIWDGSAWHDAGPYQAQVVDGHSDYNNLIQNSQFNGTVDPAMPMADAVLSTINRNGKKWLHVSGDDNTSWQGVFWRFDSSTGDFSNFADLGKKLTFDFISDNSTTYIVQTKTFDETGKQVINNVYQFNAAAGVAQSLNLNVDFKKAYSPIFELVICQDNPSKTSFNLRNPVLVDAPVIINDKNDYLIAPNTTPIGSTASTVITKLQVSKKMGYSVTNSDGTKAGILWRCPIVPSFEMGEQPFRLRGNLQNLTSINSKFTIMWQLLDANMGVLAIDFIDEISPIPFKVTALDMFFSVPSNENARFFQVLIYPEPAPEINFRVFPELNVEFCYPNYNIEEYANGRWITNFYGNFTTPFLIRYYGKTWVKIKTTTANRSGQGVAFPIGLFRGIDSPNFSIEFDIMSDDDNEFEATVHYMAADNSTVLAQDKLSDLKLSGGEFKHFNFNYSFRKVDNAQYAKVLIYQKRDYAPSFMVTDMIIEQKPISDSRETGGSTNLPRLNIIGDLTGMDKEVKKNVQVELYYDGKVHTEYATCKWQGDSSTMYPKKSYRLTFYRDRSYEKKKKILIIPDYEPTNSINVKANFIDWTGANNLLISNYVSQLTIANGDELDRDQLLAPNQSQIVGYPCTVQLNDVYNGIYTISNKSEDYMNNMDDSNATHWLISGAVWSDTVTFNTDSATFDPTKDFEVLTPDPEDTPTPEQLKSSFNELLKLTNSGTDDEFASKISAKVNLQSVANWVVMLTMFRLTDDAGKNIRWQTRDGVKWSALMYDHDLAYGADFMANDWFEADNWELKNIADRHKLIKRLLANGLLQSYLKTAYAEAVNLFPATKVIGDYRRYMTLVGGNNYELDQELYPVVGDNNRGIKYYDTNDLFVFIVRRLTLCQKWFSDVYLNSMINS